MKRRAIRIGLCLAGALALLAGCAAPPTRVVLLPQEDGSPSAVVVRTKGGERRVSQPFERATAANPGDAPTLDQADPAEVRAQNKELFALAPPRQQTFVLYFDLGGTVLTPQSQAELDGIIQAAVARPGADITVTGHTDTRDTTAHNDQLALERATEIKGLLVARGFAAERIEAIGRGERELAVPTADEVYEPRNRRVVIVVR